MPITSPARQIVSLEMAQSLLQKAAAPPEWQVTPERIQPALERSVAHRFSGAPPDDARAIQTYLDSLQAADLALACACSEGNPAAWDFFVARYRPELYRAARAIAGEPASRELADSLYAELYGLRESRDSANPCSIIFWDAANSPPGCTPSSRSVTWMEFAARAAPNRSMTTRTPAPARHSAGPRGFPRTPSASVTS